MARTERDRSAHEPRSTRDNALMQATGHLDAIAGLFAAARDRFDRYFACVDAASPIVVDVAHVIDAADLLDAAAETLQGGRR